MKWYKIENEITAEGSIKQIKVNGKKLCLIEHEGELYVTQNSCPHAGALLTEGWCKHGNIICPVHRWEYNLKTGRGAEGQGDYINTYPVEKKEDGIYVGFDEGWFKKMFRN